MYMYIVHVSLSLMNVRIVAELTDETELKIYVSKLRVYGIEHLGGACTFYKIYSRVR